MCENFKREYQICEEIGRGRYGVVSRCFNPTTQSTFAVKSIDKHLLIDPIDRECLDKEPKILQFLAPHPNILQIHGLFESDSHMLIVSDLCEESTLYDRILEHNSPFSEPEAAAIFVQLIHAIAHCHRHSVSHRDIKPENILFDSRNRLKLCDFGSAEWFGNGEDKQFMRGIVGTPYYVAPEVLAGKDYTEKVDVWSAGVILYIMLGGVPPFYGETVEETFEAVLRANVRFPPRIFRSVSSQVKDLLRKMLCKDVNRRLSAEQVLRHPWVTNGGITNTVTDMS